MALQVNLDKAAEKLRLSLEKVGIVKPPQMDLAFDLDVSGSFRDEHEDGTTSILLSRLIPWGMVFDPDQKLDVFSFSDGPENAHYVGEITPQNHENFVRRLIIGRVPGWGCGTDYSYVLEKNLQHFGWMPSGQAPVVKKGFLSQLFGTKQSAVATEAPKGKKSCVVFVTDGENTDKKLTHQVLRASEQRGDDIYFLFIGISNQGGEFRFLNEIADVYGNTGLVVIRNLRQFVAQDDEAINQQLIGEELLQWLKK